MQIKHIPRYLREIVSGEMYHKLVMRHSNSRRAVFSSIYQSNMWNHGAEGESRSGEGSTVEVTANARRAIETIIRERGIKTMLDAPCGDFNWMQHTSLEGVDYTGADIVPSLIAENNRRYARPGRRFINLDIVEQTPEAYDLINCRDCIQHLSDADVRRVLMNFSRSGSKYLLITTSPAKSINHDIAKTGDFRPINLQGAPWNITGIEAEYVDFVSDDPRYQKVLLLIRLPIAILAAA